jgi:hypothetical protein
MKLKAILSTVLAMTILGGVLMSPIAANAQSSHRQQTKNQWRNIGIGSAALGLLGLVKGNNTLTAVGAAGALYSANRYEQDRKSQSKSNRNRAYYYSHGSVTHHGNRYVRKTVWKNGHKYYQFVRG